MDASRAWSRDSRRPAAAMRLLEEDAWEGIDWREWADPRRRAAAAEAAAGVGAGAGPELADAAEPGASPRLRCAGCPPGSVRWELERLCASAALDAAEKADPRRRAAGAAAGGGTGSGTGPPLWRRAASWWRRKPRMRLQVMTPRRTPCVANRLGGGVA